MRLVFHIGSGKTGSSAIQAALRASEEELEIQGVKYLGLMLERSPEKAYPWQGGVPIPAPEEIADGRPDRAATEIQTCLATSLDSLETSGFRTAIWSNEAFFGAHHLAMPAVRSAISKGHSVEVIAYVRNHAAWARSAYIQWGIRHKTIEGGILPFSEYIKRRAVRYAGAVEPWVDLVGDNFALRNYDKIDDVVSDFASAVGIKLTSVAGEKVYETPSDEELLFRALFNNARKGQVLPMAFDKSLGIDNLNFGRNPVDWLRSLMPTEADLQKVAQDSLEDREIINRLLGLSGQPKLDEHTGSAKSPSADQGVLIGALFGMIDVQSRRLQSLQKTIRDLESRVDDIKRERDQGEPDV